MLLANGWSQLQLPQVLFLAFMFFLIGGHVGLIALSKLLPPLLQESAGSKPTAFNLASVLDHLNKSIKNLRRLQD